MPLATALGSHSPRCCLGCVGTDHEAALLNFLITVIATLGYANPPITSIVKFVSQTCQSVESLLLPYIIQKCGHRVMQFFMVGLIKSNRKLCSV